MAFCYSIVMVLNERSLHQASGSELEPGSCIVSNCCDHWSSDCLKLFRTSFHVDEKLWCHTSVLYWAGAGRPGFGLRGLNLYPSYSTIIIHAVLDVASVTQSPYIRSCIPSIPLILYLCLSHSSLQVLLPCNFFFCILFMNYFDLSYSRTKNFKILKISWLQNFSKCFCRKYALIRHNGWG